MNIVNILRDTEEKQCFGTFTEIAANGETSYCAIGILHKECPEEVDECGFWV